MSVLSRTYLHFDLNINDEDKIVCKEYFKKRFSNLSQELFRQETEIFVDVQDGSVRVVLAVLGAIYLGIGQYGSFRSGVDQIIDDSKTLHKLVDSSLRKDGIPKSLILENRRLVATPDRLRRLFLRIDRLERNSEILTNDEIKKELKSIIRSVKKISYEIDNEQDYELFISEIGERFRPGENQIEYTKDTLIPHEYNYPGVPPETPKIDYEFTVPRPLLRREEEYPKLPFNPEKINENKKKKR